MTPAKAKVVFATHMQAARTRKLTQYELNQLSKARQVLRGQHRPAMNPKSRTYKTAVRILMDTYPEMPKNEAEGLIRFYGPSDHGIVEASKKWKKLQWERGEKNPRRKLTEREKYEKKYGIGAYAPPSITEDMQAELINLYHTGRSYTGGSYEGKLYAARHFHNAYPEFSETAIYKELDRLTQYNPKRKSNPKNATLIYGQVDCIYATKKQNHICDNECKKHGHRYYHKFSSKPKMYGLPDGTLLIKP